MDERCSLGSPLIGSDHCPAMKGIESPPHEREGASAGEGSDHCPAMKGIES